MDETIKLLRGLHTEGKLVGKSGDQIWEQLVVADWIRVGSHFMEFEWQSPKGESHPVATVIFDLRTGMIADARFSVLTW